MKAASVSLSGIIVLAACVLAQETPQISIVAIDTAGQLTFTHNITESNKGFRVDCTTNLLGPWYRDNDALVFATNSLLQLPSTSNSAPCAFYRIARNSYVVGLLEETHFSALIAHETGERILCFTNMTGFVYTGQDGRSCVVYTGTNGLPERVVDDGQVFLFANYTSTSVHIAQIASNGAIRLFLSIPIAIPNSPSRGGLQIPEQLASIHAFPLATPPDEVIHETVNYLLTGVSVVGCGLSAVAAIASGGIGTPVALLACGGALIDVMSYITGNDILGGASTSLSTFLCATAVIGINPGQAYDCYTLIVGIANDAIYGGELTQANHSAQIQDALNQLRSSAGWVQWRTQDGGNGHWYKPVAAGGPITWPAASNAAVTAGGYLATLTSYGEYVFVYRLVDSNAFCNPTFSYMGPWIGAFQPTGSAEPSGGWRWVTGEQWSYTRWDSGQPDNNGNENAVHISRYSGFPGAWNDFPMGGKLNGEAIWSYVIERNAAP